MGPAPRLIGSLRDQLADLRVAPDHTDVVDAVHALLGGDLVTAMRFDAVTGRTIVSRIVSRGPGRLSARTMSEMRRGVAAGTMQFLFSCPVPERKQRNTVIEVPQISAVSELGERDAARFGIASDVWPALRPKLAALTRLYDYDGIERHHQLRALICDGPVLLSYLSVCQPYAFSARQRRTFRALLPMMRDRVLWDHHAATAADLHDVLGAALDAIGRVALVVTRAGRVLHANALGRSELDNARDLPARIEAALRGHEGDFQVQRVARDGRTYYLLVGREPSFADTARALADELGLEGTARRVLMGSITNHSTKEIAAVLDVADSTVEYHLTRLYRRLGLSSRIDLHSLLFTRLGRSR